MRFVLRIFASEGARKINGFIPGKYLMGSEFKCEPFFFASFLVPACLRAGRGMGHWNLLWEGDTVA